MDLALGAHLLEHVRPHRHAALAQVGGTQQVHVGSGLADAAADGERQRTVDDPLVIGILEEVHLVRLLELLLEMNNLEDVRALMDDYPDSDYVDWSYTALLMELWGNGDSVRAHSLLESALETNEHVPEYLLGIKLIPDLRPPYITLGGEDEAADYATRHLRFWKKTKAALKWLKDNQSNV